MNIIDIFLQEENTEKSYRKRSEVIIIKDGKIFVGVRKNGDYMLPGGGMGKNETPDQTAKREAVEEISVNCTDLEKIGGPIIITWPDIYGGEENVIDDEHRKWLEKNQLLGHINHTYKANFSSYSKSNVGPKDDKYSVRLIDPQLYIDQLKEKNEKIKDLKLNWRILWNNYTINCLQLVKKLIDGEIV